MILLVPFPEGRSWKLRSVSAENHFWVFPYELYYFRYSYFVINIIWILHFNLRF